MSPDGETITQPTNGPGVTCPTPFAPSASARCMKRRSASAHSPTSFCTVAVVCCTEVLFKQTVYVQFGIEDNQIVNLFANTRITNRQTELLRNSNRNTAFCCAIEFCQDDAGNAGDF